MTTAEILLRDAEAYLRHTAQAEHLSLLETAFVAWLRAEPEPPALAEALLVPLRQYEHVALASLAEAAGWAVDKSSLDDGLSWLRDVALERVGVPAPIVSDGLAQMAIGLAVREREWLRAWHDQVLARSTTILTPVWLAGGGRAVRGETSSCAPDLRTALASRGIGSSAADADAKEVLEKLLRGELPDDAFHAQVLLVALEWTRRSAVSELPGQAAVPNARDQLIDYLLYSFDGDEMHRLIGALPGGALMERRLPGPLAAPFDVANALVKILEQEKRLDDAGFWEEFRRQRPHRGPEIRAHESAIRDWLRKRDSGHAASSRETDPAEPLSPTIQSARVLTSGSRRESPTSSSPPTPTSSTAGPPPSGPPRPSSRSPPPIAGGSSSSGPRPGTADVAILIALREEWDVFWPIAGKPRGVKDPDSGRYLFRFEVECEVGRPYRCVALCMGDMGPGQATDATHVLLQGKPRTMVNLGIAAAIHDDLKLCDVVVADQVDDYFATAKAAARGKEEYSFELRGSVYKASYSLVQDVDSLQYAHPEAFEAWHSACSVAMTEHAEKIARAMSSEQIREHPGLARVHLASGPVLAAAASFSRWVRTRDGLLKALEMESAGMMLAAHQRSDPTSTLVLRGISDFGDERKAKTDRKSGGAFRHLAMFNATRLLWAMLGRGLLRRHEPGLGATGSVPEIVVVTLLQYGDHFRLSDPPPFASEAGAELWSHFQRVGEQDTTNVWLNQEFSRLFPGETYKPFNWVNGFTYDAPYLIMLFAAHGWDHYNTMYEPGGQASHTPSDVYTLFFRRHRVENA